jgi:hypothetical protein
MEVIMKDREKLVNTMFPVSVILAGVSWLAAVISVGILNRSLYAGVLAALSCACYVMGYIKVMDIGGYEKVTPDKYRNWFIFSAVFALGSLYLAKFHYAWIWIFLACLQVPPYVLDKIMMAQIRGKKQVIQPDMKGIDILIEICTRDDLMSTQSMWDKAVADLKQHGDEGSRALARLLNEMLQCRADSIGTVIVAAREVKPVPELISAVEAIVTASALAPAFYGARFRPQIEGGGQIGWTDGKARNVKEMAEEALKVVKAAG